jgi:dipeptidyl-peptidase-4
MPMMLLHELAHAFHNLVLSFQKGEILRLYEQAKESGTYDNVEPRNREPQKAYAMNDQMEYFAETTEAFFGENNFYPFNRVELEQHDPEMFKLLARLWMTTEEGSH